MPRGPRILRGPPLAVPFPDTRRCDAFIIPLSRAQRAVYEIMPNFFKGLAHPFRIRILELLAVARELLIGILSAENDLLDDAEEFEM